MTRSLAGAVYFRGLLKLSLLAFALMVTACGPTKTLVVRFDDLRSDLIVLESSLDRREAAGIDWRGEVPNATTSSVLNLDRRSAKIFTEMSGCGFERIYRDSARLSGV